ncbi:MAG: ATP-binding protein [Candidatus Cloacimonadota bacterium]|nr:ATP-binding protein [Candidatus Cloacimonadota bacterium]
MKLLNKAIRTFSIILIFYAIIVFVLIVHVIPFANLLLAISLTTILALLISIFYSYSIIKPVEKFNKQIEKIADGDFSELKYPTNHEYSHIFNNLGAISKKLQKYEDKLSKQKEGFYAIIESIKEAIWIQNEKGLIQTYNTSFANLIQQDDIKNQYFWNVIRNKEIYDVVDKNFKKPDSRTEEIEFDSRHFLFSTSYSNFSKETVFILYDITEFRQLETIKKDFVLSVSHELRTPLTSIKGYLETFETDLDDEHKNYLEIMKRNTDRLIHIVNDLLTLSRLEHDRSLEKENIVISDFLENITKIFSHHIHAKKLELKIEYNTKKTLIQADRFKLEQVFINLIDNAVKYTDEGEIIITIDDDETNLIFRISDSGNGIAEEHLSRLFERFYVVDKSRSRRMGGTGLGLSIAKHIVNLHDGTIDVESEIGKGTTFTIKLPL